MLLWRKTSLKNKLRMKCIIIIITKNIQVQKSKLNNTKGNFQNTPYQSRMQNGASSLEGTLELAIQMIHTQITLSREYCREINPCECRCNLLQANLTECFDMRINKQLLVHKTIHRCSIASVIQTGEILFISYIWKIISLPAE